MPSNTSYNKATDSDVKKMLELNQAAFRLDFQTPFTNEAELSKLLAISEINRSMFNTNDR